MAFAAHLDTPLRHGGRPLIIDTYLASMPEEEAEDARKLLASAQSDNQIAAAFTEEGYEVGYGAIRKWRIRNKAGVYAQ